MNQLAIAKLPKYVRLAAELRSQIESGRFQPGAQLPPEESLAKTHNLSRGTVQKAIRLLLDEGLIVREQGRGTFVTHATTNTTHFSLLSFENAMRRQNRQPSTRLLRREMVPAAAAVAQRLDIATGTPLIQIEMLRLADGDPVVYETRTLAEALCPNLMSEDLETQSIHWLLVHKYNVPLVKLVHTVERLPLTVAEAAHLGVVAGEIAFAVERLTYTEDAAGARQTAVLYQARTRADNFNLQTHL